jgi:hypothetical protein
MLILVQKGERMAVVLPGPGSRLSLLGQMKKPFFWDFYEKWLLDIKRDKIRLPRAK